MLVANDAPSEGKEGETLTDETALSHFLEAFYDRECSASRRLSISDAIKTLVQLLNTAKNAMIHFCLITGREMAAKPACCKDFSTTSLIKTDLKKQQWERKSGPSGLIGFL